MSMPSALLGVLWNAVASGDATRVRDVLEHSGKAAKSPAVSALLWHAVGRGDLEVATALIRAGADLNSPDPSNPHEDLSLLHVAAARSYEPDYERLALLLLEHGADVESRDAHDWSALFCAVQVEAVDLVADLLRRGASVFDCDEPAVSNVLETAADSEPMLRVLVFDCEDPAARNERAFFLAEHYMDIHEPALVRAMLDRGLPIDYVNRAGLTLLQCAVGTGDAEMVKLLLERGADVNKPAAHGATPLHLACFWPETTIALLLLDAGADVHATNEDGRRPLHVACLNQAASTILLLLQLGADVCATDAKGRTPLSLMCRGKTLTFGESFVIQQLALLSSLGRSMNKSDLELVESNHAMRTRFQVYSDELDAMKRVKIVDRASYFSVLSWSPARVSALTRNPDFVARFEENHKNMSEWFPAYAFRVTTSVHVARQRQNLLRFIQSRLVEIFGDALPDLVLEKITAHLCSDALRNIETNYYFKLFDNIDMRIDTEGRS